MRRCSQQVAEHSATGTFFSFSFLFSLSCLLYQFNLIILFTKISNMLAIFFKKKHMLVPLSLNQVNTHWRGASAACIPALCFSRKAALILLDKGWESQENISVHTNSYTHNEICHSTIHLWTCMQQNTHPPQTAHSHTSVLVDYYLNCLILLWYHFQYS